MKKLNAIYSESDDDLIDRNRGFRQWVATIPPAETKTETATRSKSFKELEKLKMIKRHKGIHSYMLSPELLIPTGEEIVSLVEEWNNLKPISNKIEITDAHGKVY